MQQNPTGIVHIVLLKLTEETTPEQIEAAMQGLRGMAGRIPGLEYVSCGENFSTRAQGFTHGLVTRFTDRAALDAYMTHPIHVEVVEKYINPIRKETLAFDYEG